MSIPTIAGITATTIRTTRLASRVLTTEIGDGTAVLFLHGNLSSATWWEDTMVALPDGFIGIAPDQRGYGEADPEARIDATRGMGDLVEDAIALMDHLGHERFHVVGSSLGGVVVWCLMAEHPERLLSVVQVAPGSPFGFGGTRDVVGTPSSENYAGCGAGLVSPALVERIEVGDTGTDSIISPRAALRALVWKPPFIPEREDALVASMLQVHLGPDAYPGDTLLSEQWPYFSPGEKGPNNALSARYAMEVERLIDADPKVSVLWIRGDSDLAVSNTAASDPGTWGPAGLVPGYPGPDVYPCQPMLDQTRAVLQRYAAAGGTFEEVVMDDCGHVPYIEKAEEFSDLLNGHLADTA